jgi:hypothetical protein
MVIYYLKNDQRKQKTVTLDYIKNKCYIDNTTGCWIWKTAILNKWSNKSDRRPKIDWSVNNQRKSGMVTRLAWELLYEKTFPEELQAGHTCEDINDLACFCVNPKHITPVTQSENEWMKKIYSSDEQYNAYIERAKNWGARARTKNKMESDWNIEKRAMEIYKNETVETLNPDFSTPCQLMHSRLTHNGYSCMHIQKNKKKERILLHRVMCYIKNKEEYKTIKENDRLVRHLCGNKNCIEPTHLEFGTASSNSYDCYMSGTHSGTDLNVDKVRQILTNWVEFNKKWVGGPYYRGSRWGIIKAGWEACEYNITYVSFRTITKGDRWGLVYEEFREQLEKYDR